MENDLDVERAQRNIKKAQLMNFDVERIKRKIKKAQLMKHWPQRIINTGFINN